MLKCKKETCGVIIIVFFLFISINVISSLDSQAVFQCGGDDQLLILCSPGDSQLGPPIGNYPSNLGGIVNLAQQPVAQKQNIIEKIIYGGNIWIWIVIIIILIIFFFWLNYLFLLVILKKKKQTQKVRHRKKGK